MVGGVGGVGGDFSQTRQRQVADGADVVFTDTRADTIHQLQQ